MVGALTTTRPAGAGAGAAAAAGEGGGGTLPLLAAGVAAAAGMVAAAAAGGGADASAGLAGVLEKRERRLRLAAGGSMVKRGVELVQGWWQRSTETGTKRRWAMAGAGRDVDGRAGERAGGWAG